VLSSCILPKELTWFTKGLRLSAFARADFCFWDCFEGTDLIYEGITTKTNIRQLNFAEHLEGTDLIYEGITTWLPLSISIWNKEGTDLIYEGITTAAWGGRY
jgi:hypothetical protein